MRAKIFPYLLFSFLISAQSDGIEPPFIYLEPIAKSAPLLIALSNYFTFLTSWEKSESISIKISGLKFSIAYLNPAI